MGTLMNIDLATQIKKIEDESLKKDERYKLPGGWY